MKTRRQERRLRHYQRQALRHANLRARTAKRLDRVTAITQALVVALTVLALTALLQGCGFLFEDFANPNAVKHDYVSACGAKFYGPPEAFAGFHDAEKRAIEHLAPVFGPDICDLFVDFKVIVHADPWPDPWDRDFNGDGVGGDLVGGLSGCDEVPGQRGWAEVLSDWHDLSYFHEVAHHLQCPESDVGHTTWGPMKTGPIWLAVKRAALALPDGGSIK